MRTISSRHYALALLIVAMLPWPGAAQPRSAAVDGRAVYESSCAACHGTNGKGVDREAAGHAWPLPDFTDCGFASPERSDDWTAIIAHGGPARAFNRAMPAFGDALSSAEIAAAVSHVRTFCGNRLWPIGDLNFPRPLATEKAFPENEAVVIAEMPTTERDHGDVRLIYERRLGARGQLEANLPWVTRNVSGTWYRGLGDVEAGYKHVLLVRRGTIVSGSASLTLPSGKEEYGLGSRLTVLEPSALVGQRLTRSTFALGQFGFEFPLNIASTPTGIFWRGAFGTTVNAGRAGRAWTPIVEVTAHRELELDDPIRWDIVPQLQITLSRRQHIGLSGGAQLPVAGPSRPGMAMLSLTWDWFDGGLLSGW